MPDLYLHGRKLNSVFELLGTHENDITYSIGWALAQSPSFLHALLTRIFPNGSAGGADTIRLQEHDDDGGYTDIEIRGPDVHAIVEAKRGWWLPSREQLEKYCGRLDDRQIESSVIVAMSECSDEYAALHLPDDVGGHRVTHVRWKELAKMTRVAAATHAEKRLLHELRAYLERIVPMQNQESNIVYVVALSVDTPDWSQVSLKDFVEKKRRYFHPVGDGYPKEPPNYIAFRYHGRLQSIHHIEKWKIATNMKAEIPEVDAGTWPPHFVYTLGEPIRPPKEVKTGAIYRNGRVWAMLDLLLTCDTIADAAKLTRRRLADHE